MKSLLGFIGAVMLAFVLALWAPRTHAPPDHSVAHVQLDVAGDTVAALSPALAEVQHAKLAFVRDASVGLVHQLKTLLDSNRTLASPGRPATSWRYVAWRYRQRVPDPGRA